MMLCEYEAYGKRHDKSLRSMADHLMSFLDEVRGDKHAASKLIQELAETFPSLI